MTCRECAFFFPDQTDYRPAKGFYIANGKCKRMPPVTLGRYGRFATFPMVDPYDWCGEFKMAEKLTYSQPKPSQSEGGA